MKRIYWIILLVFFASYGMVEASFERAWNSTRDQALGNSNSSLFDISRDHETGRYLSFNRVMIPAAELERTVVICGQYTPKYQVVFYWDQFGDREIAPGLSYIEDTKAFSASYLISPNLIIGGQVKSFQLKTAYEGSGASIDLGLQLRTCSWLKMGLEARDVINKVSYSTEHEDRIPTLYTLLFESPIVNKTVLFMTINNNNEVNLGCEFSPIPECNIRLGMQRGNWAGGLAITNRNWTVEYSILKELFGVQQILSIKYSL